MHPAGRGDLLDLLQFFGPECFYGLRSVMLMQGIGTSTAISLPFGRLIVPGTIVLYDQPEPPWFISGSVRHAERESLERAGASIESSDNNIHCLIKWTNENLKNFMLFEVFAHEVGHHIIQQYKGKRSDRVMRTKDHERFADAFARKCRREYLQSLASNSDA